MQNVLRAVSAALLITIALHLCAFTQVEGDPLNVRIATLDNGLTVYLSENHERPEIQTRIVVRAGSRNDPQETTGLAHYLEHLMFKGTGSYGTTDYAAERVYLQQIDSLYEVYGHTADAARRKAVYHEIDSVSYLSSRVAIANEFDKLMEGIGATEVNAFTGTEMTCYVEKIPAGELDRWAAIEAARFQDLVIRGFHTELETVYEEYNMYSVMDMEKVNIALSKKLYPELSYRQYDVIGLPEHLKNPSIRNVRAFYNTYYRPNNVAVCLSGDLDYEHAMAIIEQHFGSWQPNEELPALMAKRQAAMPAVNYHYYAAPVDTTVYGQETESLVMAWRFPAIADKDNDIVELISDVLQNGKCGLMDMHLTQQQRVLDAWCYSEQEGDYTTFMFGVEPKQGQSLEKARELVLAEISALKQGHFSDELLHAIQLNARRDRMEQMQSNDFRVNAFTLCHIYGIPFEQILHSVEKKAAITKEDIVRVANQYFTDSYVTVFKRQKKVEDKAAIEKPTISPIEMNRERSSAWRDSLSALSAERLSPQFLDWEKDLTRRHVGERDMLYRRNTENELFHLSFIANSGYVNDPVLELATRYFPYLRTDRRSVDELMNRLYALACDLSIDCYSDQTYFTLSGLEENRQAALQLAEDWLTHAVADKRVYKELVADLLREHEDGKTDQNECFRRLAVYGQYGAEAVAERTLTPQQLRSIRPDSLLAHLQETAASCFRVVYYGPASVEEVEQQVSGSYLFSGKANTTRAQRPVRRQVYEREVLLAPYDAPNLILFAYADRGEVYHPKDEALIMLFNAYFGGSMGSIVFQEMREARALAYTATAEYSVPDYAGDTYGFQKFILSQNDKMQLCIEAFDSICNYMPLSEKAFVQARESLLRQIEQRRYVRSAPIHAYMYFEERGWNHDWYSDIYTEVQTLTLADLERFAREKVANSTFRYMILGNEKALDTDYLSTLGPLRRLTLKDIFVY